MHPPTAYPITYTHCRAPNPDIRPRLTSMRPLRVVIST